MVRQSMISREVLNELWNYMTRSAATTDAKSAAAVQLLAMAAVAKPEVVATNVDLLVAHGLGERAAADFELGRRVCYALSKLVKTVDLKSDESVKTEPLRLDADHAVFERLHTILVEGASRLDDSGWTPLMEEALNVVFGISEHPDAFAAAVVKGLAKICLDCVDDQSADDYKRDLLLTRFAATAGHAALRMLMHVDVSFMGEQKRRGMLRELHRKRSSPRRNGRSASSRRDASLASDVDACEDEMGLEDVEQDQANQICEEEILGADQLLGLALPLITHVLHNFSKFSPQLQTAAALALSKMMLVSKKVCAKNLALLVDLLSKSPIAAVRANVMIAAGDLSHRFPNSIDPYSKHLYERLHDPDRSVRQNCLLVLTHLILNDMIKAKSQISDIALCTLDERNEMAVLAKRFFAELAQKGNAVYNLMPDIISRLSDASSRIPPDDFKTVMKFLLPLIGQKERHSETLVEKLCQRFQNASDAEDDFVQWRYLSFCLTQLNPNERLLRKLSDNFSCYADKLSDAEVYENFAAIVGALKKSAKMVELKPIIEEFETRLRTANDEGASNEQVAERAKQQTQRRGARLKPSPRKKIKLEQPEPDDDDDALSD